MTCSGLAAGKLVGAGPTSVLLDAELHGPSPGALPELLCGLLPTHFCQDDRSRRQELTAPRGVTTGFSVEPLPHWSSQALLAFQRQAGPTVLNYLTQVRI